jgi:hypothetical protein
MAGACVKIIPIYLQWRKQSAQLVEETHVVSDPGCLAERGKV